MATVNLAPRTEHLIAARRRQKILFFIAATIAIVVALIWLGLVVMKSNVSGKIEETQGRLRTVENEIAKLATIAERIQLFEDRLVSLNKLLDTHIHWDPLLKEVERLLPPPTTFLELATTAEEGTLKITGTTTNLDQLAQTLASLENSPQHTSLLFNPRLEFVTQKETINEANPLATVEYQFEVTFSFNPTVLAEGQL